MTVSHILLLMRSGAVFFILFCVEYSLKYNNLEKVVIILDSCDCIFIRLDFDEELFCGWSQILNQDFPTDTEAIKWLVSLEEER